MSLLKSSLIYALLIFSCIAPVWADDAADVMDAALQDIASEASPQPATTDSTLTSETQAAVPAHAPEPAAEEPAPSYEPVKARDVLPQEEKPVTEEELEEKASAKAVILEESAQSGQLMVADFDIGDKPNNLGGDFGGWDKDPNDDTQGCRMSFVSGDASGTDEGFALRLDYDVDSPSPAYNGFWMKLENLNATPYDTMSIYFRGASDRFSKRIKVELKTPDGRSSPYYLSGISKEWKKFEIPLKRFKGIKDWSVMSELILVFDDVNTAPKKGTILVDQVMFERKESGMPVLADPASAHLTKAPESPAASAGLDSARP